MPIRYSLEKVARGGSQDNRARMLRGPHKWIGQPKGQQHRSSHGAAAPSSGCVWKRIGIRIQLLIAMWTNVGQDEAEDFHVAVMKAQNARI